MEIGILLLQLDWTIFKGVIALFGLENFIKKFLCRALPWFWMVITKVFSIMMKKVCACGGGVGGHLQVIIMSPKQSLGDILCLLRFFLVLLLLFFLSFFCQKFIWYISRRLQNGNQWNFTGMLSTMSRCADYFRNFQNGCHCHGNGQNAKKLKNTKMIIAGYSPNRNWWNLIGSKKGGI